MWRKLWLMIFAVATWIFPSFVIIIISLLPPSLPTYLSRRGGEINWKATSSRRNRVRMTKSWPSPRPGRTSLTSSFTVAPSPSNLGAGRCSSRVPSARCSRLASPRPMSWARSFLEVWGRGSWCCFALNYFLVCVVLSNVHLSVLFNHDC